MGYITIKKIGDCENIRTVNPLHLLVNHASAYIEEKNGNKYFILMNLLMKTKRCTGWKTRRCLGWNQK